MAELVPKEAVILLYRRYLKTSQKVPNMTIRLLLIQQIRNGFRRYRTLRSPVAQRELIAQAQKDLMILEDERHSRTLYINRFGMVSCLEWEVRRTEWHVSQNYLMAIQSFFMIMFALFVSMAYCAKLIDDAFPEIAQTVDYMAAKLEVDNPGELWKRRQADLIRTLESQQRQDELERRILATFRDVPKDSVPPVNLRDPDLQR